LNQKIDELWITNKNITGTDVIVDSARYTYANVLEFGPRDFATGEFQLYKFPLNRTYGAGRTNVGLRPKFSVI